jgi:hypothetical protein
MTENKLYEFVEAIHITPQQLEVAAAFPHHTQKDHLLPPGATINRIYTTKESLQSHYHP